MNLLALVLTALFLTLVLAGCGRSPSSSRNTPPPASRGSNDAPLHPNLNPADPRIIAFVAWLKSNGVTLENAGGFGKWRVVQPRNTEQYDVTFYIASFPSGTSERRMREGVKDVNLAYLLNARAHLAMSYGGIDGKTPEAPAVRDEDLPRLNGLPITQAAEQLFAKYKPD